MVRTTNTSISSFDGEEWKQIKNSSQLQNSVALQVYFRQQLKPHEADILKEIANIESIKELMIVVQMDKGVCQILDNLSLGIYEKQNLQKLTIKFSRNSDVVRIDEAQKLSLCLCKNVSMLELSFKQIDKQSLVEISNGIKDINNLECFDFMITEENEHNESIILRSIQNHQDFKSLKIIMNNSQDQNEQPKSQKIDMSLYQCEYLYLNAKTFLQLTPLKQYQKLQTLILQIDYMNQQMYESFSQNQLPHLQSVECLRFKLKNVNEIVISYLMISIKKLENVKRLKVTNYCDQLSKLGDILQVLSLNQQIKYFNFRSKVFSNNILVYQEDINFLKNIEHLKINLFMKSSNNLSQFFKNFKNLDKLITLTFFIEGDQFTKYILKAKRLVTYNQFS